MNKKIINLIIAIVLGLVAVYLVNSYIEKSRTTTGPQTEAENIIIAARNIREGEVLDKHMLAIRKVPVEYITPGALSPDRYRHIAGKAAAVNVREGTQITSELFTAKKKTKREIPLSEKIPSGYRAVNINVEELSGNEKLVAPGDRVDVIAVFPFTESQFRVPRMASFILYQNREVLAVDGHTDKSVSKESIKTITLPFKPEETGIIAYIQKKGDIKLALRAPGDTKIREWGPEREEILGKIYKEMGLIKEEPPFTVRIYRGGTKNIPPKGQEVAQ